MLRIDSITHRPIEPQTRQYTTGIAEYLQRGPCTLRYRQNHKIERGERGEERERETKRTKEAGRYRRGHSN